MLDCELDCVECVLLPFSDYSSSFVLQLVYINPKPDSLGLHFPGVDITMNGNLNALPLEPPNPAVCVGNGFVMEVTNDVSYSFLNSASFRETSCASL